MITTNTSKFRELADRMTSEIEHRRSDRRENTPKQQREAKSARIEADHFERAQRAMYALAEAQENGTLPGGLKKITTKAQVLQMTKTRVGSSGYYEVHDTDEFTDNSELAIALRALVESSKNAEDKAREAEVQRLNKIKDMEANVRFAKITGFHPTPRDVCQLMVNKVQHFKGYGAVLEPSVGNGELAEFIQSCWPNAVIACCEINHTLCEIARAKGFDVHQGDFLEHPPVQIFKLIAMNPIFEGGADVDHIRHAYEFLMPGGELVAIASAGIKFNSRKKYESFRMFLTERDADVHDLPMGAFESSLCRTSVSTVMIYLRRPE